MLVVGASSGIGLAAAQAFARQGANVALCARRQDRLAAAAGELGEGAFAVPADVRDPESAAAAVETAVECLGGLTDLVYAAGVATLANVAEASAEQWREVFDVNVMGPSLITAAALPHLAAVHGRALYVSSIAAEERPPRRGLSLYSTTKAALNRLIECWQTEQRAVSFTRVSVGDTNATEFASTWDPADIASYVQEWLAQGYLYGRQMTPEDVAQHLVDLLVGPECVPVAVVTPRYPDA